MISTYVIDKFELTDRHVKITFTNDDGLVHERHINIPHLEDESVNEEYFQEIIQGQLRGVENKLKVGAVTFIDPDANTGIAPTSIL